MGLPRGTCATRSRSGACSLFVCVDVWLWTTIQQRIFFVVVVDVDGLDIPQMQPAFIYKNVENQFGKSHRSVPLPSSLAPFPLHCSTHVWDIECQASGA
jgi:hypothetical protein